MQNSEPVMARYLPKITGCRLAIIITIVMALFYALYGDGFTLFKILELKTLDWRFRVRGTRPAAEEVVVVAIDDYSIEALGRWPWPRYYHAEVIDRLARDGAKIVGFDLMFTEPEDNPGLDALNQLSQYYKSLSIAGGSDEGIGFGRILEQAIAVSNNDEIMAASLAGNNNVGVTLVFQGLSNVPDRLIDPAEEETIESEPLPALPAEAMAPPKVKEAAVKQPAVGRAGAAKPAVPVAEALLLPMPDLYLNAKCLGHVNWFPDVDGSLRWASMLIEYQDELYPSFGLSLAREYLSLGNDSIRVLPGQGLSLGETMIPLDRRGRLLLNYYGPAQSFAYYSYADVIDGRFPPGTFRNKAVLIGGSATGLGDLWLSPFSQNLPGVEKHATVIANILQNNFLRRSSLLFDIIFILVSGLVAGLVLPGLRPLRATANTMALLAVIVGVNFLCFYSLNLWLNLIYPLANFMLVAAVIMVFRFGTVERQRREIKNAFNRYLSPLLVEELAENPQMLRLGGEQRDLSVLFCDVRDFTSFSEKLTPEQVVAILNVYLTRMAAIILENKGTVDKFIGDAIMAIFGAPLQQERHSQLACLTAIGMIRELDQVNTDLAAQGLPAIKIGISINSGSMVVGNLGSEQRFDYTVIGDSVNLAARLEGLNKLYGTRILISEYTAVKTEGIWLREIDLVKVKGKTQPVKIFEVLGLAGEQPERAEEIRRYNAALKLYYDRQWPEAAAVFADLHEETGAVLYGLYLERVKRFIDEPPPADWDWAIIYTRK